MFKKIISIVLALLLLALTGCGSKPQVDTPTPTPNTTETPIQGSTLDLLYCANDTLNPYNTINKLNAELSSLMFDPLVKTDNSFGSVFVLAKEIKNENNLCTVTLIDAFFSDSSKLTSADVIFSYELAKKSERYSSLFYEVESVTAVDEKTVLFTLTKNDPYFRNLLNFPILKTGSDQLKNEDNVELVPIGTGRYVFNTLLNCLEPNPKYYGEKPSVTKINLLNAPDNESMERYVKVGATDIYYTGSSENIVRMSGQKRSVNLNNLVYIGLNHYFAPLKNDEIRHILSSAISRKTIVEDAFYSNAVSATGFFHPSFKDTSGYQTLSEEANLKICVENLANIGYNRLNEEGFYENKNGDILEFDLLVNKDSFTKTSTAELIKKQLGEAGIKINVVSLPAADYTLALQNGQFQIYLGEVKLQQNMDISPLVIKGGSAAYGMPDAPTETTPPVSETPSDNTASDTVDSLNGEPAPENFDGETSYISVVKGYYRGETSISDIASALLSSMPVIPLVYRNSVVFYSDEILNISEISCYDILFSADKYKVLSKK